MIQENFDLITKATYRGKLIVPANNSNPRPEKKRDENKKYVRMDEQMNMGKLRGVFY